MVHDFLAASHFSLSSPSPSDFRHRYFFAEMWVVCLRAGVNHLSANTTGFAEGYHKFLKALGVAISGSARRLDRLIYFLRYEVLEHFMARQMMTLQGATSASSDNYGDTVIAGASGSPLGGAASLNVCMRDQLPLNSTND